MAFIYPKMNIYSTELCKWNQRKEKRDARETTVRFYRIRAGQSEPPQVPLQACSLLGEREERAADLWLTLREGWKLIRDS